MNDIRKGIVNEKGHNIINDTFFISHKVFLFCGSRYPFEGPISLAPTQINTVPNGSGTSEHRPDSRYLVAGQHGGYNYSDQNIN